MHSYQAPRRQLYAPILTQVRRVMISRMAKPEEVLVVENEQGEVVREFMKVGANQMAHYFSLYIYGLVTVANEISTELQLFPKTIHALSRVRTLL